MIQQLFQKFYFIPVLIIWLFLLIKYRRILGFKFKQLKEEVRPGKEIFLPLLAIMAVLITFALVLPFAYDEAFTFTQFTNPGFQQALFNYPVPNNHVFHSVLTCITWGIFRFTQMEIAVRLPALFFSAFTLYFVFTRYMEGKLYAVILFGIMFLFSPNIIEFAFQARGYSIQIFCALASYYFATDNKAIKNVPFFARVNLVLMLTITGLFTNPAYLYTAICVYLVFITLNYREIKKQFGSFAIINVFYALTLLLLYTPIIASKGLHTLTSNDVVAPVDAFTIDKQLSQLNSLVKFVTFPKSLGWVILILFIWNTIKQKAYYNVYFLVIPVILMNVLKQLPYYRIFLPIGAIILLNACVAITTTNGFKKLTAAPMARLQQVSCYILIAASCILSYYYFDKYHEKDDLKSAYRFIKIRSAIDSHELVYTKNIGASWDVQEMLWAYLRLHGTDDVPEIDKDLKEYNLRSAIIISSEPLPGFKIIYKTTSFEDNPIMVLEAEK
jgi:hypothetical protein